MNNYLYLIIKDFIFKIKNFFEPEKRGNIYCNQCDCFREFKVAAYFGEHLEFKVCVSKNNVHKKITKTFYGEKIEKDYNKEKTCYQLNKHHDCNWFIPLGTSLHNSINSPAYKAISKAIKNRGGFP